MYLSLERSIPYSGANAPTRLAYNVFNFSNLSFQLLHVFLVDAYNINLKLETLLYFRKVLQLPHHCCRITPELKFFFTDQHNDIHPGIPRAPEI
jgi:hypothetical protein